MRFAVLDVETTGLYPGGHDRIVEVAVISLNRDLTLSNEFTTLLNPNRDLGPTWLHGIRAADVMDAPGFPEVAGRLVDLLRDSVIVGHNVTFDLRFLESEFARMGYQVGRPSYFDTMDAALSLGAPSRRLEEACDYLSIPLQETHSALSDARATAALFARCVEHAGPSVVQSWMRWAEDYDSLSWPSLPVNTVTYPRSSAATRQEGGSFLATLVRDLPVADADSGNWQAYYALLDRALEDRRVSTEEAAALREVASEGHLTVEDVKTANETYLRTLIATALHDRVLSDTERRDILEVAKLLDLERAVAILISEADAGPKPSAEGLQVPECRGRTVCFTGELCASIDGERATRERATKIAQNHGMIVVKGVTKKLDYLVLADPDSLSGKAKKARKYGTRLVAEAVFWNWMDISTDG